MNIFKKAASSVNNQLIAAQAGVMSKDVTCGGKLSRVKSIGVTAFALTAMFSQAAMADDFNQIGTRVNNGLKTVFDVLRNIALPVGIVSLVACGIAYFFGGEKGMENGKKWAFRIGIGLGVVALAPTLITAVYGLFFSNNGTDSIFGSGGSTGVGNTGG